MAPGCNIIPTSFIHFDYEKVDITQILRVLHWNRTFFGALYLKENIRTEGNYLLC